MLTVNLRRLPAWRELYELQIATFALFLGFVPFVGTAMDVLGSAVLLPAAAIYAGVLLYVQRKTIDWKCPRCGNAFLRARENGFALPFRSRCGTCGLKRGSSSR